MCIRDRFGTLYKGCNSAEAHKNWLGEVTNPRQIKGGLKEALEGADVFIGVSKPGILTTELCKTCLLYTSYHGGGLNVLL